MRDNFWYRATYTLRGQAFCIDFEWYEELNTAEMIQQAVFIVAVQTDGDAQFMSVEPIIKGEK